MSLHAPQYAATVFFSSMEDKFVPLIVTFLSILGGYREIRTCEGNFSPLLMKVVAKEFNELWSTKPPVSLRSDRAGGQLKPQFH